MLSRSLEIGLESHRLNADADSAHCNVQHCSVHPLWILTLFAWESLVAGMGISRVCSFTGTRTTF